MIRGSFYFPGGGGSGSPAILVETTRFRSRPVCVTLSFTGAKETQLGIAVLDSGNGVDWHTRQEFRTAPGITWLHIPKTGRLRIVGWNELGWARGTILCEEERGSRDVG